MNKNSYIEWNEELSSDIRRNILFNSFPKNTSKETKFKKIIKYLNDKSFMCNNIKIRHKINTDKKYYENQFINYLKNKKEVI